MSQCPATFRFPCIRTESGEAGLTAEQLANILSPYIDGGVVSSVFGRTGDIIAVTDDYAASEIDNDSSVSGATVAAALNTLLTSGGAGKVAQMVVANLGTVLSNSGQIPFDNTVPQQTEGFEVLTKAITPVNANSTLLVSFSTFLSIPVLNGGTIALFRDSTAAAIAATHFSILSADTTTTAILQSPAIPANSINETTFKVRVGANVPNTIVINGTSSGQRYGGVASTILTVTEILP